MASGTMDAYTQRCVESPGGSERRPRWRTKARNAHILFVPVSSLRESTAAPSVRRWKRPRTLTALANIRPAKATPNDKDSNTPAIKVKGRRHTEQRGGLILFARDLSVESPLAIFAAVRPQPDDLKDVVHQAASMGTVHVLAATVRAERLGHFSTRLSRRSSRMLRYR